MIRSDIEDAAPVTPAPLRMFDIAGVLYRPEDALRLGLVDADGELTEPAPEASPVGEASLIIHSATAQGVPDAGHDTEPAAPGGARPADAAPPAGKRQRGRS